jgi:presenilin-like A22 family membrane protease
MVALDEQANYSNKHMITLAVLHMQPRVFMLAVHPT